MKEYENKEAEKKETAMEIDNRCLDFNSPKTIQQADALEHFKSLTPQQRTELLAEMLTEYMALSRIIGKE